MATFDQLLAKLGTLLSGGSAPSNAMAGARNVAESLDPQVEWRGSMLPIVNYDNGTGGFGWPQMAVDAKNAFARFHRGEAPQPQDAVLAGLVMSGGVAGGLAKGHPVVPRLPKDILDGVTHRGTATSDVDLIAGAASDGPFVYAYNKHTGKPVGEGYFVIDDRGVARVDNVNVIPEWQRQGIGRSIYQAGRQLVDDMGATSRGDGGHYPPGIQEWQSGTVRPLSSGKAPAPAQAPVSLPSHSVEAGRPRPTRFVSDGAGGFKAAAEPSAGFYPAQPTPASVASKPLRADYNGLGLEPLGDTTYRIFKDGELIGSALIQVQGDRAFIQEIHVAGGPTSLGVSGIRDLREAFRQLAPQVTRFEGERASGARNGPAASVGNDKMQRVTLFANAPEAAPAGLLPMGGEGEKKEHHSRAQPRNPMGQFVTADSFDGRLAALQKVLVDLDGDGAPDAVAEVPVPTNAMAQMAKASEDYAPPPSNHIRQMMPDYEPRQSPYYLEDMQLDTENEMRGRQGLPPKKGPPFQAPAPDNYPFRGNLISRR